MFSIECGEAVWLHCDDSGVRAQLGEELDCGLRREILEGMVSGLEHHVSGKLVLHASCVAWGDSAVALMGEQGAGKSSLSFACTSDGGRLLSDGMTVVAPQSGQIVPGLGRFKLTDESIRGLGLHPEEYERVSEQGQKRYVPSLGLHGATTARLRTVLWLTEGEGERIEPMGPREQLLALIRNGYLVSAFPVEEQQHLLERASTLLAAGVIVKRLLRRLTWDTLPDAVQLVRREAEGTNL